MNKSTTSKVVSWYRCWGKKLRGSKFVEFQVSRWPESRMFDFYFWNRKKGVSDHHGFDIDITLFYHEFRISFYDSRHVEDFK